LNGKTLGPHKANHDYRIISSHSFPIFNQLWGADEELLLIEGSEMYGLGNWSDIAEHVGGRTKEECQKHYEETYLNLTQDESIEWPLPKIDRDFSPTDLDTFQSLKKTRLELLQSKPLPLPPPKPLASAPTCHEIGGYMPARLEFEHEFENEAEVLIKDLEFGKVMSFGGSDQPASLTSTIVTEGDNEQRGSKEKAVNENEVKPTTTTTTTTSDTNDGEEPETELELKLSVLEMFNEKYDKRMMCKDLIFDRGLINYKTISALERKRNKDERDLINRSKVFSRIQTSRDHEEFVDGLLYEITLKKRIAELQEYRRNGITTLSSASQYDHLKSSRQSAKQANYHRESLSSSLNYDRTNNNSNRPLSSSVQQPSTTSGGITFTSSSTTSSSGGKKPSLTPLTLATSNSLHLLTNLEKELCSTLRMLPRPYLFLKQTLLREFVKLGSRMNSLDARKAVRRRDEEIGRSGMGEWGEKVERVWEFLKESGGLQQQQTLSSDDVSVGVKRKREEEEEEDDDEGGEDEENKFVKMELEV